MTKKQKKSSRQVMENRLKTRGHGTPTVLKGKHQGQEILIGANRAAKRMVRRSQRGV